MTRPDPRFDLFDPPPGGLVRLRGKLDARRRRWRNGTLAGLLLIALAGAGLPWWGPSVPPPRIAYGPSGVRFGVVAEPLEPVVVTPAFRDSVAVRRVQVEDPRVQFYLLARVASQDPPALPEPAEPDAVPPDDERSWQVKRTL